jgi:hypothetical protein
MDGSPAPPQRERIARFTADGALDGGFTTDPGANAGVYGMALQADGKVLIGGFFTQYGSVPRNRIARVNPNGSLDHGFKPGSGATGPVYSILPQADHKALIGGAFYRYNGVSRYSLARLFTSGGSAAAPNLLLLLD